MAKTKHLFSLCLVVTAAAAIGMTIGPPSAWAALGGDAPTVEADRAKLQASLRITSKDRYLIHEMHAPNDVVVREFVSPEGKVFGVAWQGPSRPDLQQVLGAYFEPFTKAAEKAKRVGHGPLVIREESGLVVHLSGHARSFVGKAYVAQMVPAGVHIEEIQ